MSTTLPELEPAGIRERPRSRGRFGWFSLLVVALTSAGIGAGAVRFVLSQHNGGAAALAHEDTAKEQYHCPMHPTIVQDHPGNCPICGMKLVKVEQPGAAAAATAAGSSTSRQVAFYRSPMDPNQTSPSPRKDAMGMDYLPVYADEMSGAATPVAGLVAVDIDPGRQQLIGLRTAEVVRGKVGGHVRTVGRVAVDETRVRHINVKTAGFVERIFVDFVGKRVSHGDPLFSLYSPELLAAQEEFLLAVRTRANGATASGGGVEMSGQVLVDAARRRLALWDVSSADVEQLERSGEPTRTITFYSPVSGFVTKKNVVEGMKLDAGAMPYEIVDLSTVWLLADVYESELRFVKEGAAADLTLKAFPNRRFHGKVVFIDPFLDPQTRTIKVRLTFPNATGDLRPEMFGEVVLKTAPREGLVVPADAIVDSGTEKIVFVAEGEGKFRPRMIEMGQSDGTLVEVTRGLMAGEKVVTRANFLVDSESRLRASLGALSNSADTHSVQSARVLPSSASTQAAGHDTAGHDTAGHDTAGHDTAGHDTAGHDASDQPGATTARDAGSRDAESQR